MLELLKKSYKLEISFGKDHIIEFNYIQAPFKELLEISYMIEKKKNLVDWLFDFLNTKCEQEIIRKPKIKKKFLMKKTLQNGKMTRELFNLLNEEEVLKITKFILKTYGKEFFADEDDFVPKVKNLAPSSSMICYLLEHTSETTETLLNLTWEQIKYLFDGIIYNANEATKKGRARNKTNQRMKEARESMSDKEALEKVKELEDRLQHRNKK